MTRAPPMHNSTLNDIFIELERADTGVTVPIARVLDALPFGDTGLLPAIAQQHDSLEVLMLAWMNRDALLETLSTGRVCYWSRSRARLWRKGETSGQVQRLKSMRLDCDGDTLLLLVDQQGPACHTGRRSCFYNELDGVQLVVRDRPIVDPESLYPKAGKPD